MGVFGRETTKSQNNKLNKKKVGLVYNVILDSDSEYAVNSGLGSLYAGCIQYKAADMTAVNSDTLPIAFPSDKNFKSLPVKNELVEIYTEGGNTVYRRIFDALNPSQSNPPNTISSALQNGTQQQSVRDYQRAAATGITNTNSDTSFMFDGFGEYYEPQVGLHKLKLYEGDTLIESRFGQSIRFSGYNNVNNIFSPTLILRNGESAKNRKLNSKFTIEEDVNGDGSIIVMGSDQYQLTFQPGTVSDSGTSDFETKPDSFAEFPSKLIGDQILINSGRLIFSAKNAEMIFYSKKNYGFISDGAMSIDNKLGIDINVNDNINVITNDRDIVMFTGNGSIFLGSGDLEPIVKGQQLVNILSELIDAIAAQTFLTPSGPTADGPVNIGDFGKIKSKLNDILSKLNQTA
jgi:hypothetical protein